MTGYSLSYVYTKSIYTRVIMKYLCKKYLSNCNFVLIILKLLTINKKARQCPPFYFRDLLRCVTYHLISNDDYSYARLLV